MIQGIINTINTPTMKTDKPIKKGFFAILRESFAKTGGCCGAGETCGAPAKTADKSSAKETKDTGKAGQK